ncbi:hypothetical protein [Cribrihabitans neustonicus]|uniref:hypothetical protein n=1 Tax=Cribrihabitans neustonicus TaxID=1429085 RepID=UPI003B5CDFD1
MFYIWNRLRYSKHPDTGRRVSKLNPPEAWKTQEVPELRILMKIFGARSRHGRRLFQNNAAKGRPTTKTGYLPLKAYGGANTYCRAYSPAANAAAN